MRDPSRIRTILQVLGECWNKEPDLSLGQLLVGVIRPSVPCPGLFYIEDEELLSRLQTRSEEVSSSLKNIPLYEQLYSVMDTTVSMLETTGQKGLPGSDPLNLMKEFLVASNGTISIAKGEASGDNRANRATEVALAEIFHEWRNTGEIASALVNVKASDKVTMDEYEQIVSTVMRRFPVDITFVQGLNIDNTMGDKIIVTIIAGG